jgi:outer membrane protein
MFVLVRALHRLGRHIAAAALCAATVTVAQPARADSFSDLGRNLDSLLSRAMEMMPSGVRNVRFGLGPAYDSHFLGDNSRYVHLAPVVSLRYRNLISVDNNSVRVNVLGHWGSVTGDDSPWSAGPVLRIDFGRSESDSPKLAGLGDIGTSVEPGVFVGYNWGPFRGRVRIRKDISDATNGLIVDTDLNFGIIATDKLFVNANLYGVWGNGVYNNAYFGVTPQQ